jgi:D-beta-D-heptose 7-phosphate kinase/D-beta-D-heptose 1-phosphate adenosyltransferase
MLRVDYESRAQVTGGAEQELRQAILKQMRRSDLVVISDYDKGVCTPALLTATIAAAKSLGQRVLADPIRGSDYRKYHGSSAITPNRLEAGLAAGLTIRSTEEALAAGQQLREQLDLEAAIVTLDKDGMALAHRDGRRQLFTTRPRQVYDITGAGDMVLSMLAMTLAAGASYDDAIRLANVAGGLEVEKIGVATVTRDEILRDLLRAGRTGWQKVLSRDQLKHEIDSRRRLGQRVAFTNGCFDVLHAGHVDYLYEARGQGDCLVVGLNSDASVQRLKGPTRPVQTEHARAQGLAAL